MVIVLDVGENETERLYTAKNVEMVDPIEQLLIG
ncbi:hypothetical protein LCGC14_1186090 [marine sediment metagenome]|uniref:Uncharacterized protein n=1 Tax=marine sediment metagenome TaxID=412755 RepID=A0A0F9LQJ6_9ZZZZ